MTTRLKTFKDPYAIVTVAQFEPLILGWVSGLHLAMIATLLSRQVSQVRSLAPSSRDITTSGSLSDEAKKRLMFSTAAKLTLGTTKRRDDQSADSDIAVVVNRSAMPALPDVDTSTAAANLTLRLLTDVDKWAAQDSDARAKMALGDLLTRALRAEEANVNAETLLAFFGTNVEAELSPIGVAHYYRQLFFNRSEGIGPIEEAFAIAPGETFEVVYETSRRLVHEEEQELGSESLSEMAMEEKTSDELSSKVSTMINRDTNTSISANVGGGIGVWHAGASVSANIGESRKLAREDSDRRLRDITKRSSERITRSFTVRSLTREEVTTRNLTRRTITNTKGDPVNYGLRRVLREVDIKVQEIGPRLVWQLYLKEPGSGMARSSFVHFRDSGPIVVPDLPPGCPPPPVGGTASGRTDAPIDLNTNKVTFTIPLTSDRKPVSAMIDSMTDLDGGDKGDKPPVPNNEESKVTHDPARNAATVVIGVTRGTAKRVSINYTYTWQPSDAAMSAWEAVRTQQRSRMTQELLTKKFEDDKALLTAKSKIRPRPANDLRREERYEVMNRMVSHFSMRPEKTITPLEIELFHRFFDIDGIFVYNHPSWWLPRYNRNSSAFERPPYEITAESEPAPAGSSLGWIIQLDGDRRRNEFLNSPWCRACVPIRPGREKEAIRWLGDHVEGNLGGILEREDMKKLFEAIEARHAKERVAAANMRKGGVEYVTLETDAVDVIDEQDNEPKNVFPVISTYTVTIPTEGFVYDKLDVNT